MTFSHKLGEVFPDIALKTTMGDFTLHEYISKDAENFPFTILFSHPADFTPVCTTELGVCDALTAAFNSLGAKLIGVSCDSVESHLEWSKDICAISEKTQSSASANGKKSVLNFPIIGDDSREVVSALGMLDPLEKGAAGLPMPARALFIIGAADFKLRLSVLYPATTGRNYDEILRCLKSLTITKDFSLATPANWNEGERVMVAPSVSSEDAAAKFSNFTVENVPSGKKYLRYVDAPKLDV